MGEYRQLYLFLILVFLVLYIIMFSIADWGEKVVGVGRMGDGRLGHLLECGCLFIRKDNLYIIFDLCSSQDEVMRFLVEVESVSVSDPFCRKIMKHLEYASKQFIIDRK